MNTQIIEGIFLLVIFVLMVFGIVLYDYEGGEKK